MVDAGGARTLAVPGESGDLSSFATFATFNKSAQTFVRTCRGRVIRHGII
jgi:hypothetical protein